MNVCATSNQLGEVVLKAYVTHHGTRIGCRIQRQLVHLWEIEVTSEN